MKCPICAANVKKEETHCPSCGMLLPRPAAARPARSFDELQKLSKRTFWKEFAQERLYKEVESALCAPLVLVLGLPAIGCINHPSPRQWVFWALAAAAAVLGLGMFFWMSRACAAGLAVCGAGYLLACHIWGGGIAPKEWTLLVPAVYPLFIMWDLHTAYTRFQRVLRRRGQPKQPGNGEKMP